MRRLNSLFQTDYISEKGLDARDRTYFAYVPLSNYACYVIAESYDDSTDIRSDQLAVESVLTLFQREPSMKTSKIKKYINYANDQLKANSTQYKLQASILIVVSDYTRMRYASCGNSKLFVVNENQLVFESGTQTRYQSVIDSDIYEEALDIGDAYNLTQYLGKEKKLNISVSKKINLFENSSLVLMTCGAWNKLLVYNRNDINENKRGVEIIDAYESSKTNGEFLLNLEEMLLNFQQIQKIGSYGIASIAISKTFKEDTAKKKKRRKTLLIIGIILLVVLIIVLIVFAVIRHNDRTRLNAIIELDKEGVQYAGYGNYVKSLERYRSADELAKKISLSNLQYIREKKELTKRIKNRLALLAAVDDGNKLIESKNYSGAKTSFIYVRDEGDGDPDLNLLSMSREMLRKINYYIEAAHFTSLGEMYELIGLYSQALLNYQRAFAQIELTDDFDARKTLQIKIIDVEKKIVQEQQDQVDILMSENERNRQALLDHYQSQVDDLKEKAAGYEKTNDLDSAIDIYETIHQIYIKDMGYNSDKDVVIACAEKLEALYNTKTAQRTQKEIDDAMAVIDGLEKKATVAERNGNYEEAISYWEDIEKCYDDMNDRDGRRMANDRITDLLKLQKEAEAAEAAAIAAAEAAAAATVAN